MADSKTSPLKFWFGATQEQRQFEAFDGCAWRVTWHAPTDQFLVEISTEDPVEDDPFSSEREWLVRKFDHADYWSGITLFHLDDSPELGEYDICESQIYNLATQFKRLGYYDFTIAKRVICEGHLHYEDIRKVAFEVMYAKNENP